MPRIKTNSGAKKRFIVTGSGKIKRKHAYKRHLLGRKAKNRKKELSHDAFVHASDKKRIKRILGLR